jgi:hypothetical protein
VAINNGCILGTKTSYIDIDYYNEMDQSLYLIAHEIGHSLGLSHNKKSGIMKEHAPRKPFFINKEENFLYERHK